MCHSFQGYNLSKNEYFDYYGYFESSRMKHVLGKILRSKGEVKVNCTNVQLKKLKIFLQRIVHVEKRLNAFDEKEVSINKIYKLCSYKVVKDVFVNENVEEVEVIETPGYYEETEDWQELPITYLKEDIVYDKTLEPKDKFSRLFHRIESKRCNGICFPSFENRRGDPPSLRFRLDNSEIHYKKKKEFEEQDPEIILMKEAYYRDMDVYLASCKTVTREIETTRKVLRKIQNFIPPKREEIVTKKVIKVKKEVVKVKDKMSQSKLERLKANFKHKIKKEMFSRPIDSFNKIFHRFGFKLADFDKYLDMLRNNKKKPFCRGRVFKRINSILLASLHEIMLKEKCDPRNYFLKYAKAYEKISEERRNEDGSNHYERYYDSY